MISIPVGVAVTPLLVFLLQTLQQKWEQHKDLNEGVELELMVLQNGLSKLEAFLKDVENKNEKDYSFMLEETQIRELIYDVEDFTEMYFTKTTKSDKMKRRVRHLIEIMKPILTKIDNYKSKSETTNGNPLPAVEMKKKDIKCEDKKFFVEFQDEADFREGLLKSNKEELDVFAITGMAGLGKTEFARKIFKHEDVKAQFSWRIWIEASEKFNSTDAFREILKKITNTDTFVRAEDLIDNVRQVFRIRKKFLLVVNDVWRKEDWEVIKEILPEKNDGRVILTTRELSVAQAASDVRQVHHLKILDKDKSFELLKYQVLDKPDERLHGELENVGRDIAEKCGGMPLMILVIGGILRDCYTAGSRGINTIREKWSYVLKNMDECIRNDPDNLISDAVELSYKRLSHDLKLCFLYTGLFPGDDEISVSTLTQLWIAEGFVPWNENKSAEKSADEILKTLIEMNLVMVSKKNLEQVKTCRVHDIIRVFCRKKAASENLFRVIEPRNEYPNTVNFRRICLNIEDPLGFLSKDLQCQRVRSCLSFSKQSVSSNSIKMSIVLDVSTLLRVLNCRSIIFKKFPKVEKLMLLKHLALFIEKVKSLPREISQLVNLKTLIVHTKSKSITVEAKYIWKMVQLRRLKITAVIKLHRQPWEGEYRGKLQTISRMPPKSCNTGLSKKAPYLKTLGVQGKLANAEMTMNLKDFTNLEKLKLVNELGNDPNTSIPMAFTKLDWFPPNLKSLTLSNTQLKWRRHMPILALIEKLEILKLKKNAFTGEFWNTSNHRISFPNLMSLLMDDLELTYWMVPNKYFPKLSSLVIKNSKLNDIPTCLPNHLESLEIENVNRSLVASAKEIARIQIINLNKDRSCEVAFKLIIDQVPFSVTIDENSAASSSGQGN